MILSEGRDTVLYPAEWLEQEPRPTGIVFGYHHPETGVWNLVGFGEEPTSVLRGVRPLGEILVDDRSIEGPPMVSEWLLGVYEGDSILFNKVSEHQCDSETYCLVQDLFSRNAGVLECDALQHCTAIISGCGSVGSDIALELARAGVGHFVLVDFDTLSYHNLCRHRCGIEDVGRFKCDAVRDGILNINPHADVIVQRKNIERVTEEVFEDAGGPNTIIVGAADSREADLYANQIACLYGVPFCSIGLWERAFAGEVFYCKPGEMPCYYCAFGLQDRTFSARATANRHLYTTQTELEQLNFEPGISIDIGFCSRVALKVIIDLLMESCTPNFEPRVLGHLAQYTLVCNTNDPNQGGELAELFSHPLQITSSIQIEKLEDCPHCQMVKKEK